MVYILISISFLLHLVSILAIIVLYQRRSLERVSLPSFQEDVEAIHQSIESFIDEIEKENESLYHRMIEHIKEKEKAWSVTQSKLEEQLQELMNAKQYSSDSFAMAQQTATATEQPVEAPADVQHSLEKNLSSTPTVSDEKVEIDTNTVENQMDSSYLQQASDIEPSLFSPAQHTDPKFQHALDLYNQGFSSEQIARVLKIGKGEAQLIVNMIEKYRQHSV